MDTPLNILLVEDSDLDVEILMRSLKKIEATGDLVRARDGQEALEMLHQQSIKKVIEQPFLVLLDINMPRMNGHEFLDSLRAQADIADTHVIVFSTSANPKDIRKAYARNAAGYVVKPDSSSDLREALQCIWDFWKLCAHPPRYLH